MAKLVTVIRLALKLAWLRLVIAWYSITTPLVLAGWFNWMGGRWHIRKGAKLMGLYQQPGEAWEDFQRRVFDAHRAETGIDVEELAKAEIERRRRLPKPHRN